MVRQILLYISYRIKLWLPRASNGVHGITATRQTALTNKILHKRNRGGALQAECWSRKLQVLGSNTSMGEWRQEDQRCQVYLGYRANC